MTRIPCVCIFIPIPQVVDGNSSVAAIHTVIFITMQTRIDHGSLLLFDMETKIGGSLVVSTDVGIGIESFGD